MTSVHNFPSYASTNFKYVICIDSSTCIAADDSTALGLYKVDILSQTVTYFGFAGDIGPIKGMAYLKNFNMIKIFTATQKTKIYLSNMQVDS